MKHTWNITLLLIAMFFAAQIAGLGIITSYLDIPKTIETGTTSFSSLPFEMDRPQVEESFSYIYITIAVIAGTLLLLLLIKFRGVRLWKLWFFFAVMTTITISLSSFLPQITALSIAVLIALWKIYRPNIYIHNISEILIYGGLAAIFVPIMNIFSALMLLLIISAYDVYAVWKSKHMISMAKFQTENKLFSGIYVPYDKKGGIVPIKDAKKLTAGKSSEKSKKAVSTAILGGGDIGFTLIFAGVVLKELINKGLPIIIAFSEASIVASATTIALSILFFKSEKGKFYPAMPFLTIGCLVGYGIVYVLGII